MSWIDESGMLLVSDPRQLVGGDPELVRFSAARMRQLAGELDQAEFGLSRLDTAHWQGEAADAFRASFAPQPTMWRDASDAFDEAAQALSMYANAMVDGQARAAQAIRMFRESLQITEQAKAAHDAKVAAMAAGPHALAVVTNPPPFEDPGKSMRSQAVALANQAIGDTQAVGDEAAAIVRAASSKAPPKPGFWDRVEGAVVGATGTAGEWVVGSTVAMGEWTYNHVAVPVVNNVYKAGAAMVDEPLDTLQTVGGVLLMGGGIAITDGGIALDATGAGAVAGVPISAAGVAVAGAGACTASNGAHGLAYQFNKEPNIMHATSSERSGGEQASQSLANDGLGQVVPVNAEDPAADALARRIGGSPSVKFSNDPSAREFDGVSDIYIAQAKPSNFTLNQAFRNQAKATFEYANRTGRIPYFQFDGPPGPGVLDALERYAERYGTQPVIDLKPLG